MVNMKSLPYKLNLQRYLRFLNLTEDNDFALGIYDKDGELYELTCFDHSKSLQAFLQQKTPLSIAWDQLDEANNTLIIDNVGYIQFVSLVLGSNDLKFWLVACHKTDKVANEETQKIFLNNLVHCFRLYKMNEIKA